MLFLVTQLLVSGWALGPPPAHAVSRRTGGKPQSKSHPEMEASLESSSFVLGDQRLPTHLSPGWLINQVSKLGLQWPFHTILQEYVFITQCALQLPVNHCCWSLIIRLGRELPCVKRGEVSLRILSHSLHLSSSIGPPIPALKIYPTKIIPPHPHH